MTESVALLADILVRATPLIFSGLAVAIAFQAGVLNIGADGQLLVGATAAAAVGIVSGHWGTIALPLALPSALLAGACAGGAWASIAAYLRLRFGVLDVISTIMLNFVAAYGVSYLVRGPLQEPTHIYPQTDTIADVAQLPRLIPGTRLHAGFLLAILLAVLLGWMVRATAAGFRLRVVGANAQAASVAGMIDADRVTFRAFVLSGALAGLAGAVEICGVTYSMYENLSPGYGYTAIAVALLAALNPIGVIATGILFGALEAAASALQRDANVPATLAAVIEATLILAVIAAGRLRLSWRRLLPPFRIRNERHNT